MAINCLSRTKLYIHSAYIEQCRRQQWCPCSQHCRQAGGRQTRCVAVLQAKYNAKRCYISNCEMYCTYRRLATDKSHGLSISTPVFACQQTLWAIPVIMFRFPPFCTSVPWGPTIFLGALLALFQSIFPVEELETNLISLAILFHFLCAQHVSDINISIFRSLRLCC